MVNKFQLFSGIEVITSLSCGHLMLVYDYASTNRFPLYVYKCGLFYSYQSCFNYDGKYLVVYSVTDLNLKSLLELGEKHNVNLYIEYIYG